MNQTKANAVAGITDRLETRSEAGDLHAVLARTGVGKTSFLVQIGLEHLLTGADLIHLTAGQTLDEVEAHYDTLFRERSRDLSPPHRESQRNALAARRFVQAFGEGALDATRLSQALSTARDHLKLKPTLAIMDATILPSAAEIQAWKDTAREAGLAIWCAATTHREDAQGQPNDIPPLPAPLVGAVELVVFLQPRTTSIRARLLRPGAGTEAPVTLDLSAATLSPLAENGQSGRPAREHTLMSGGLKGAEAAFGECAERWGLAECTFSFAGRTPTRTRGLVTLDAPELKLGDVSWNYLKAKTGRSFKQTVEFRKVVQSIWHQVNQAGEVFAVGCIQEDGTVKGGTGWAVELAKFQHKPVWVFDQETDTWQGWDGKAWSSGTPPVIGHLRFAGAGTRHLNERGAQAIEDLFLRSFGPAPARD